MLRALVFALALAAPGIALAQQQPQQFRESAVGIEVRGDDGTVIGQVNAIERDARGRVVAVEIDGQEPGTAPYAPRDLVAQAEANRVLVADRRDDARATGGERTRTR